MNLQDQFDTITNQHAKAAANLQDSAAFAYATKMLDRVKEAGGDPADYEVVFGRDEFSRVTKDGFRATCHIRLERRKDIANLPVLGEKR